MYNSVFKDTADDIYDQLEALDDNVQHASSQARYYINASAPGATYVNWSDPVETDIRRNAPRNELLSYVDQVDDIGKSFSWHFSALFNLI